MKEKKGGNLICMRPDSIIEARFSLNKKQNDILDMVFATIENDNKLKYEINVIKYTKLYNIQDKSNIYGELKKAVKTFEGKGFSIINKISEKKQNRIYFAWFSSIQYFDGEGKIVVEIGQTLKELLLEVKRAVFYNIQYTLNFNCIYSKRLYYYLKLYEDTGMRIDNLDILREKLECPESYKKYANFRRFVLEPSYKEINGHSDIEFEFEEVKTKNKVTNIKFYIKSNGKAKNEIVATQIDKEVLKKEKIYINNVKSIIKNVTGEEITDKAANEFYQCATKHNKYGSDPLKLINEVAEYSKTQNIKKGFVGWFKATVPIYEKPIISHRTTNFNDYEQRSYDYDELERKLLGWDK
ncbi:replication initiation protein [Clostridium akagii]|uniref:replication initiation protein n=1 Tax=Clostridium akagii TaxID=91623 RepID=UPI00047C1ADC|nr:RepB family plasmid replication initiator protein [Clostridium akagii]